MQGKRKQLNLSQLLGGAPSTQPLDIDGGIAMSSETLTNTPGWPWRRSDPVSNAAKGDRASFDLLISNHKNELRSFLSNKVRSEALDDLLQDIWLATWESLPHFDRKSAFKTWLFGIAMNKVRDHWRRKARLDHEVPIFDLTYLPSRKDELRQAESTETVRSLLAELSFDQREVLDLYYRADLNLPEVARALGRNLNTVKYQFYRAHERLADYLKAEAYL